MDLSAIGRRASQVAMSHRLGTRTYPASATVHGAVGANFLQAVDDTAADCTLAVGSAHGGPVVNVACAARRVDANTVMPGAQPAANRPQEATAQFLSCSHRAGRIFIPSASAAISLVVLGTGRDRMRYRTGSIWLRAADQPVRSRRSTEYGVPTIHGPPSSSAGKQLARAALVPQAGTSGTVIVCPSAVTRDRRSVQ